MDNIEKELPIKNCWRCGGAVDHDSKLCVECGAYNRRLNPEYTKAKQKERIEKLLSGETEGIYFAKDYVIIDTVKMTYDQYHSPEVQKQLDKKRFAAMAKERAAKLNSAREKGTHTKKQWLALVEEFEYRCLRCGNVPDDGLTKDHIQKISCGGSDAMENIQPLCRQCNSAQEQFDWVEWRRANRFGLGTNCFCWMR